MIDFQTQMYNLIDGCYQTESIFKFLGVVAEQLNYLHQNAIDLEKILDIDQASGANLDIFLNNYNLSAGDNDIATRNKIKTSIRANNSEGTLLDIIEISRNLAGTFFNGVRETWETDDGLGSVKVRILNNPNSNELTNELLGQISSAGVSVEVETVANPHVDIQAGTQQAPSQMGVII